MGVFDNLFKGKRADAEDHSIQSTSNSSVNLTQEPYAHEWLEYYIPAIKWFSRYPQSGVCIIVPSEYLEEHGWSKPGTHAYAASNTPSVFYDNVLDAHNQLAFAGVRYPTLVGAYAPYMLYGLSPKVRNFCNRNPDKGIAFLKMKRPYSYRYDAILTFMEMPENCDASNRIVAGYRSDGQLCSAVPLEIGPHKTYGFALEILMSRCIDRMPEELFNQVIPSMSKNQYIQMHDLNREYDKMSPIGIWFEA